MLKAIIFDVDGVLLDSFEANFQFYIKLLGEFGYPAPTREAFGAITHMTMEDAIRTLAGITDGEELKRIWDRGREPFDKFDTPEANMPVGAKEIVEELSKQYKLGIVTSRVKSHIFEGDLGSMENYFQVAVGYEDTEHHKPHPEPLLKAVELLGLEPGETIYVGDALTDVQAGIAANVRVISYGAKTFPGTVAHAASFDELPALVAQLHV